MPIVKLWVETLPKHTELCVFVDCKFVYISLVCLKGVKLLFLIENNWVIIFAYIHKLPEFIYEVCRFNSQEN